MTTNSAESLYLHIPFCDALCSYCDFAKVLSGTFSESRYLDCLLQEIDSKAIPEDSLKTIYIGGGTPSALSEAGLKRLLCYLHGHFPSVSEFTLEANPESLTPSKAHLLAVDGVNRVSLGVQSVNPDLLKRLRRNHTPADAEKAVLLLKKEGITNINLDFIYGLPGMVSKDLQDDFAFAFRLQPKHLSFYSLQIEEGTFFYNEKVPAASDEELFRQYKTILRTLESHGYPRYEVSNFAKPGYESQHNLTYWHDQTYYACGLGASQYLGNLRSTNTKSMTRYLAGDTNPTLDVIRPEDEKLEYLMLNLRLAEGFSLKEYQERFQEDFLKKYFSVKNEIGNALVTSGGRIRLRKDKFYVMDGILLKLV
jgi:oxygen-independent coproporphyrinogen-3 oxidase